MRDSERDAPRHIRLKAARIPEEFRDLTWDDLKDDATVTVDEDGTTDSVKDILMGYAEDWDLVKSDADGLVLLGPPGWGKTMGTALLAMDIIDQGAFVRFISYTDLVAAEVELFAMAREAERVNDWELHEKEELRLRWVKFDCELLVLDDVGKERRSASDLSSDLLERVLRRRVSEGKCTIITSNLITEKWATYNHSMESFLWQVGDVLEYADGHDHRARQSRPARERRRQRGTG